MTLMQIFHIFSNTSSTKGLLATQAVTNSTEREEMQSVWPEVERRTTPDRRHCERRVINYQPYIDTRKNHGRRRSFGRRASDQMPNLPD